MANYVSASVTAADSWTAVLDGGEARTIPDNLFDGKGNISVAGTFSATVTLQRRRHGSATWRDTDTFTSRYEGQFWVSPGYEYRIGVKSGEFTSGTAEVSLDLGI